MHWQGVTWLPADDREALVRRVCALARCVCQCIEVRAAEAWLSESVVADTGCTDSVAACARLAACEVEIGDIDLDFEYRACSRCVMPDAVGASLIATQLTEPGRGRMVRRHLRCNPDSQVQRI